MEQTTNMSTPQDYSDRRRHARFELLDYAFITQEGQQESTRCIVVDISLGGLQVRARNPFVSGAVYQITIGQGESNPITVKAEARHSKSLEDSDLYSTGFRLVPTTAVERIEWVEYVHNIFKTQGDILLGNP